ncbi:glycosyltransferase family 4 protein [Streptomyces sp. NP160]|uniref:glycosyltransferase family 4 protein n=1 Tax=Streptomyces sp. NP160 TaxID=2586637 RepID=UPI0015D5DDDA|nr:glycosyltransferase family 4 protein [Streptomyces sp. NP160]
MRRLRIAHVTNAMALDGTGVTNAAVDLALEQRAAGHQVAVLCRWADEPMRALLDGAGVLLVEGVEAARPSDLQRAVRAAAPVLRRADVVHVHTVRATAVALLAAPARFATRSVSTLHNPYQRSAPLMWTTRRVVSISAADRDLVARRTRGLRRPAVVLNGTVGSRRLPPADALQPVDLGPHAVVYVGALYARKGVDVLLRAMVRVRRELPSARLHLVGNRDNPQLEQLADDLGLGEGAVFEGFSPDPRRYMKGAAVVVLPSRAEGFGLVLVEARSTGVPVVATRVGGIPEALDGGRAGLLVDPEDDVDLARALLSVLTDEALAVRLRLAALEGLERAHVARAAREYAEVYASLPGLSAVGP